MKENQGIIIKEISLGMALYFVIATIPVLIFTQDKLKGVGGLAAGVIVAFVMLLSMNYSIEHAVHMQSKQSAYLAGISAVRLLIVAVLLCLIAYTGWLNIYTTLVGLLGLKAATYLQPFIAKLLSKLNK